MPTTFLVFELGSAPSIDTVEGNQTSENHAALNGLTFGSRTDPVASDLRSLSPAPNGPGSDGDATSYNPNNAAATEQFQIDGGPPRTFDAVMAYANTVITYTDGTTATVTAQIMQDTDGRIYLIPSNTGPNAYTDALEAKPIAAVTLGTATPARGTGVYGMYADRYMLTVKDGSVEGTAGDDVIDGSYTGDPEGDGIDGGDNLAGNDGDVVLAGDGNDRVEGGAGGDSIDGGTGDDTLIGGTGDDRLSGGAGRDTAVFAGPVTDYSFAYGPGGELIVTDSVPGRDGADTIDGFEYVVFDGVTYHLVTGDAGDNTTLQAPDDGTPSLIIAHDGNDWGGGHATSDAVFGGAGDDTLDGGDGEDTLVGEADDDLLRGDGGDDVLIGGADDDTLQGGAGNDTLDGGEDDDLLTGGEGNDVFVYRPGGGFDTITDFNSGDTGALDDGDPANNDFIDLSGFYDNIAEVQDDYADDGILNQSNAGNTVRGESIDYSDNTRFEDGDGIVVQSASRDAPRFTQDNTGVICFTPGTLILTELGECPVEDLRPGDRIVTRDNGVQTLRWLARRRIGAAEFTANTRLRPVLIRPGLIGAEDPLLVSPQHGVLVRTETGEETLVRAIHLARRPGGQARVPHGKRSLTYIHLMFDAHQIVFANGAPSESFYPGAMALAALSDPARQELRALFPDLFTRPIADVFGPTARSFARPRDMVPGHHDLRVA